MADQTQLAKVVLDLQVLVNSKDASTQVTELKRKLEELLRTLTTSPPSTQVLFDDEKIKDQVRKLEGVNKVAKKELDDLKETVTKGFLDAFSISKANIINPEQLISNLYALFSTVGQQVEYYGKIFNRQVTKVFTGNLEDYKGTKDLGFNKLAERIKADLQNLIDTEKLTGAAEAAVKRYINIIDEVQKGSYGTGTKGKGLFLDALKPRLEAEYTNLEKGLQPLANNLRTLLLSAINQGLEISPDTNTIRKFFNLIWEQVGAFSSAPAGVQEKIRENLKAAILSGFEGLNIGAMPKAVFSEFIANAFSAFPLGKAALGFDQKDKEALEKSIISTYTAAIDTAKDYTSKLQYAVKSTKIDFKDVFPKEAPLKDVLKFLDATGLGGAVTFIETALAGVKEALRSVTTAPQELGSALAVLQREVTSLGAALAADTSKPEVYRTAILELLNALGNTVLIEAFGKAWKDTSQGVTESINSYEKLKRVLTGLLNNPELTFTGDASDLQRYGEQLKLATTLIENGETNLERAIQKIAVLKTRLRAIEGDLVLRAEASGVPKTIIDQVLSQTNEQIRALESTDRELTALRVRRKKEFEQWKLDAQEAFAQVSPEQIFGGLKKGLGDTDNWTSQLDRSLRQIFGLLDLFGKGSEKAGTKISELNSFVEKFGVTNEHLLKILDRTLGALTALQKPLGESLGPRIDLTSLEDAKNSLARMAGTSNLANVFKEAHNELKILSEFLVKSGQSGSEAGVQFGKIFAYANELQDFNNRIKATEDHTSKLSVKVSDLKTKYEGLTSIQAKLAKIKDIEDRGGAKTEEEIKLLAQKNELRAKATELLKGFDNQLLRVSAAELALLGRQDKLFADQQLYGYREQVTLLNQSLNVLGESTSNLTRDFGELKTKLSGLGLSAQASTAKNFGDALAKQQSTFKGNVDAFANTIDQALAKVLNTVGQGSNAAVQAAFKQLFEALKSGGEVGPALTALKTQIMGVFNALATPGEKKTFFDAILPLLDQVDKRLVLLQSAGEKSKSTLSTAFNVKVGDTQLQPLVAQFTSLGTAITDVRTIATETTNTFSQFKAPTINTVIDSVTRLEKEIGNLVGDGAISRFETELKGAEQQLKSLLKAGAVEFGVFDAQISRVIALQKQFNDNFGKDVGKNLADRLKNVGTAFFDIFSKVIPQAINASTKTLDFGEVFRAALKGGLQSLNLSELTSIGKKINEALTVATARGDTKEADRLKQLRLDYEALTKQVEGYNTAVNAGAAGIRAANTISFTSLSSSQAILDNLGTKYTELTTKIKDFGIATDKVAASNQILILINEIKTGVKGLSDDSGKAANAIKILEAALTKVPATGFDSIRTELEASISDLRIFSDGKKILETRIGGNFQKDIEFITYTLTSGATQLQNFQKVSADFQKGNYFGKSADELVRLFNTLQRLQTEFKGTETRISKQLMPGKVGFANPAFKAELENQRLQIQANTVELEKYRRVLELVKSSAKLEAFTGLQEALSKPVSGGIISGFVAPLNAGLRSAEVLARNVLNQTQLLSNVRVDTFKQTSKDAEKTYQDLVSWKDILIAIERAAPKTTFKIGSADVPIATLITRVDELLVKFKQLPGALSQAETALKERLNTPLGQLELRASTASERFGILQTRLGQLSVAAAESGAKFSTLQELINQTRMPFDKSIFFSMPKDTYGPIRNELSAFHQELKATVNTMTAFVLVADAKTKATPQFQEMTAQLGVAQRMLNSTSEALAKLQSYAQSASEFSALRENLGRINTTMQELAGEGAVLTKAMQGFFGFLAKNITPPKIETATIDAAINHLGQKFEVAGAEADKFRNAIKNAFNQKLDSGLTLAQTNAFVNAFGELEKHLVRFRSGMIQWTMGVQMAGQGMLEPFKNAVKGFEEFSDRMGIVKAVSNATTEEFTKLQESALLMGATTRFFSEQAAEGLEKLARAGFTVQQQLEVLPSTMRLAQAAATDLATAAEITTTIMNEFRMDPAQFAEAADVIALAANATNASVQDLGYSFKYVGALAANVGADFSDLAANIALMHNAGMKGTMAGTALRGILQALFNPTKDEAKLMEDLSQRIGGLGLVVQDSKGNFVGFSNILRQLESAGITTGEVLRLFGQRAGPGMAALLAMGSEKVKKLEEDLANAAGTSAKMADVMENTLKGRLLLAESAVKALSEQVGHNLEPVLKVLADTLAYVVNSFVAFRAEFPSLSAVVDNFGALLAVAAAAIGSLAVTFSMVIIPTIQFIGFLKTLTTTFFAAAGAMSATAIATGFQTTAQQILNRSVEQAIAFDIAHVGTIRAKTIATIQHTAALQKDIATQLAALASTTGAMGTVGSKLQGLKNIFAVIVSSKGLAALGKFFISNPWGLLITGATTLTALTLAHGKSVEQTNEELRKQNEIIEYSRKEAELLSSKAAAAADELKRLTIQREALTGEDKTTKLKLDFEIGKSEQEIQSKLKEFLARISDAGSKLKDIFVIDFAYDPSGNFSKFVVNTKDGKTSIDILSNGIENSADKFRLLEETINSSSSALKNFNSDTRLTNTILQAFGKASWTQAFSTDTLPEMTKRLEVLNGGLQISQRRLESLNKEMENLGTINRRSFLGDLQGFYVDKYLTKILEAERKHISDISEERVALTKKLQDSKNALSEALLEPFEAKTGMLLVNVSEKNRFEQRRIFEEYFKQQIKDLKLNVDLSSAAAKDLLDSFVANSVQAANSATQALGAVKIEANFQAYARLVEGLGIYREALAKELKTEMEQYKKVIEPTSTLISQVDKFREIMKEKLGQDLTIDFGQIDFDLSQALKNIRVEDLKLPPIQVPSAIEAIPSSFVPSIRKAAETSKIIFEKEFSALTGLKDTLGIVGKESGAEFSNGISAGFVDAKNRAETIFGGGAWTTLIENGLRPISEQAVELGVNLSNIFGEGGITFRRFAGDLQGIGPRFTTITKPLERFRDVVGELPGPLATTKRDMEAAAKEAAAFDASFKEIFGVSQKGFGINIFEDLNAALKANRSQAEQTNQTLKTGVIQTLQAVKNEAGNAVATYTDLDGALFKFGEYSQRAFKGLTTIVAQSSQELTGFKGLLQTQLDELTRQNKVVELPISFKVDMANLTAGDFAGLTSYNAQVLSYEKVVNEQLLAYQVARIEEERRLATQALNEKAAKTQEYVSKVGYYYGYNAEQIKKLDSIVSVNFLKELQTKKSEEMKFLQDKISSYDQVYNKLYQLREGFLNKERQLNEENIQFQANIIKSVQEIDDLGRSDWEKEYIRKQQIAQLKADADLAVAKSDYEQAKELVKQRVDLIKAAQGALKAEDSAGRYFVKEAFLEAGRDMAKIMPKAQEAAKAQAEEIGKLLDANLKATTAFAQEVRTLGEELGNIAERLAQVRKDQELGIKVRVETDEAYQDLTALYYDYQKMVNDLSDSEIQVKIDALFTAEGRRNTLEAMEGLRKAREESLRLERTKPEQDAVEKSIRMVQSVASARNEIDRLINKLKELAQLETAPGSYLPTGTGRGATENKNLIDTKKLLQEITDAANLAKTAINKNLPSDLQRSLSDNLTALEKERNLILSSVEEMTKDPKKALPMESISRVNALIVEMQTSLTKAGEKATQDQLNSIFTGFVKLSAEIQKIVDKAKELNKPIVEISGSDTKNVNELLKGLSDLQKIIEDTYKDLSKRPDVYKEELESYAELINYIKLSRRELQGETLTQLELKELTDLRGRSEERYQALLKARQTISTEPVKSTLSVDPPKEPVPVPAELVVKPGSLEGVAGEQKVEVRVEVNRDELDSLDRKLNDQQWKTVDVYVKAYSNITDLENSLKEAKDRIEFATTSTNFANLQSQYVLTKQLLSANESLLRVAKETNQPQQLINQLLQDRQQLEQNVISIKDRYVQQNNTSLQVEKDKNQIVKTTQSAEQNLVASTNQAAAATQKSADASKNEASAKKASAQAGTEAARAGRETADAAERAWQAAVNEYQARLAMSAAAQNKQEEERLQNQVSAARQYAALMAAITQNKKEATSGSFGMDASTVSQMEVFNAQLMAANEKIRVAKTLQGTDGILSQNLLREGNAELLQVIDNFIKFGDLKNIPAGIAQALVQMRKDLAAGKTVEIPLLDGQQATEQAKAAGQIMRGAIQGELTGENAPAMSVLTDPAKEQTMSLLEWMQKYCNENPLSVPYWFSAQNALPTGTTVEPVSGGNKGGLIGMLRGGLVAVQNFAAGGAANFKRLLSPVVPGSGDTDTVPAMLTPGEFVIRKPVVQQLGEGFLNFINSGMLQFKQLGGLVYNTPINSLKGLSSLIQPNLNLPNAPALAGGPPIDINLSIGNKGFNIKKVPRDSVGELVGALRYLERGLK